MIITSDQRDWADLYLLASATGDPVEDLDPVRCHWLIAAAQRALRRNIRQIYDAGGEPVRGGWSRDDARALFLAALDHRQVGEDDLDLLATDGPVVDAAVLSAVLNHPNSTTAVLVNAVFTVMHGVPSQSPVGVTFGTGQDAQSRRQAEQVLATFGDAGRFAMFLADQAPSFLGYYTQARDVINAGLEAIEIAETLVRDRLPDPPHDRYGHPFRLAPSDLIDACGTAVSLATH